MARSGVLIIFTRAPVPGRTKTRLIPALGADGAVRLHMQLLEHTISAARQSRFKCIEVHSFPDTKNIFLRNLVEKFDMTIRSQRGMDLGERMFNSLKTCLLKHDFAVIVGSDCPGLNQVIMDQAYEILEKQEIHAVLGPSSDGGYYLIGMKTAEPSLFRNTGWGGAGVVQKTRELMSALGWQWQETTELRDIDVPADLKILQRYPGLNTYLPDAS